MTGIRVAKAELSKREKQGYMMKSERAMRWSRYLNTHLKI